MGTLLHIAASGSDGEAVEQAIAAANEAVDRVERLMSFHDPQSELSRVNRDAYRSPQQVHPWTYAVLRRAVRISAFSGGLFDITVAPLLVDAGFLPRHLEPPSHGGGWQDIQLLSDHTIQFTKPLMLDLGGIAKGFAIDQAIHALRRAGCTQGVVNAGGDLRRFGHTSHVVHLRRADWLVPVAELVCGAIATSGPNVPQIDSLAQPIGCIIDPIRGEQWKEGVSVMVAAPSCVIADALTKVAALAGPACQPVLARFGAKGMLV